MPDGAIQQSAVRINMNGLGELDGQKSSRCLAIQAALAAGGIPADVSENVMASLWLKFFGFSSRIRAAAARSTDAAVARSRLPDEVADNALVIRFKFMARPGNPGSSSKMEFSVRFRMLLALGKPSSLAAPIQEALP
jgi:hypothetical protein